jgi:glycerol-3-phosphate dehydrogenase
VTSGLRAGSSLNPARRARELTELVDGGSVDLLVVGGGITGAGVALDAASRGLSVALVERRDLAFGTSRWSSKLVHGGLRYLARLQLSVAYESARERHLLLTRTAPHLARPLPFLMPLPYAMPTADRLLLDAGAVLGELLRRAAGTSPRVLPRTRPVSPRALRRLVPAAGDARGGLLHWDGQLEDDARLVVAVARTAASFGARVITYCLATQVDGSGADVQDQLTGATGRIRARVVVVAAGVWSGQLVPSVSLRPSRGSHLVLRPGALGELRVALILVVPGTRNRWVFALPRPDRTVLVGITDDPDDGPPADEPAVPEADEQFLLATLNSALGEPVGPADVVGRYAGLRPLLRGSDAATADLSRRHALLTDAASGVLTIVGGKLTTYRRMAEDTVDAVVRRMGGGPRSRTARLPLVGAAAPAALSGLAMPADILRRYGTEAPSVLALAERRPELLDVVGGSTRAVELLFGALHEGAMHVDDLLDRRTRLGLVPAWRAAARPIAEALLAEASEPVG